MPNNLLEKTQIYQLERMLLNNPDIDKFVNKIVSKFKVRKIYVECVLRGEIEDLAIFDDFKKELEFYIRQGISNCKEWSNIPRRKLESEDLCTYGVPYLFFTTIERRTK